LDPHAEWDNTAWLLAAVYDAIRDVAWVVTQVNSKNRVPHPKPLPRPGAVVQELAPAVTGADLAKFLAR
jgi:hypothetical protein